MDEVNFLRVNEEVKKKQATIQSRKQTDTPTIPEQPLKSDSLSKTQICTCGKTFELTVEQIELKNLPLSSLTKQLMICKDCKAVKDAKLKANKEEQLAKKRRQERCQKKQQLKHQLSQTIPSLFRNAHLRDLPRPLCERILSLRPEKGLFLWGEVGTGKSHIMAAIARYAITKNKSVKRMRYDSFLLKIRDTFKSKSESELAAVTPFLDADIVIFEDIGTTVTDGSQESDFSLRMLLLVLDTRLENGKPMFLTSNKSPEEIERSFDSRVGSRLVPACEVIRVTGKDKRRGVGKTQK